MRGESDEAPFFVLVRGTGICIPYWTTFCNILVCLLESIESAIKVRHSSSVFLLLPASVAFSSRIEKGPANVLQYTAAQKVRQSNPCIVQRKSRRETALSQLNRTVIRHSSRLTSRVRKYTCSDSPPPGTFFRQKKVIFFSRSRWPIGRGHLCARAQSHTWAANRRATGGRTTDNHIHFDFQTGDARTFPHTLLCFIPRLFNTCSAWAGKKLR